MSPFHTLLVTGALIAIMVIILALGGWFLIQALNPEPNRSQARLAQLNQNHSEHSNTLSSWIQKQTEKNQKSVLLGGVFDRFLKKINTLGHFDSLIEQANLKVSASQYISKTIIIPIIICILIYQITHWFAVLFGLLAAPGLSWGLLKWKALKQIGKLEAQLPDALTVLASSLRAGYSFQAAMQLMADQLPEPIVSVFTNLNNDLKLGVSTKESMGKMVESVPISDYRIFSTAVLVQREVGGNLAEVMDRLAFTIRERFKLKKQVSVLTAQPRLSAYILGAGPTFMFCIFYFFFNDYLKPLYTNLFGQIALVLAFGLQLIGFYIMWKIVDIKY
ncbi:MAG: type II secretion system F family protein [Vampirovibrionales bacterium]